MSRQSANRANANTVADHLRKLRFGNMLLGQAVQTKRKLNPSSLGVGSYTLGTLHALQLPDHSRAAVIHRATARAGSVTGELTPVAYGTTPATGQIAVAPNGDIVTLAADAITDLDVVYSPERGDVVGTVQSDPLLPNYSLGLYFPVVSHVLTLPSGSWMLSRGVSLLLEAEAVAGTSVGKKIVLTPGAGAPSAGQCRLNAAKTTITFATADAVTRARIKLSVGTAEDLQAVLSEIDSDLL